MYLLKKSFDNFVYLRKETKNSVNIIPTFHRGEHISNLERLLTYSDEYGKLEYIGIGAVASNKSRIVRDNFLDTIFSSIQKIRPDMKTHLFGLTDLSLLNKYPIYSADSTTWLIAGAMGEIITDFGRIKISDKNFKMNTVKNFNSYELESLQSYLLKFGFSVEELQSSTDKRQMFNITYMKNKADNISQKVFKPKNKLF